jgi:hypothetical protein
MKRDAREFLRSTTTLLDHVLTKITQDEQSELLEALSGEITQRLDARAERGESCAITVIQPIDVPRLF